MSVAISFSSVQDKSAQNHIFGLQVAVTTWVRAFLRYTKQEKFTFLIKNKEALEELEACIDYVGVDKSRFAPLDARFPQENLEQFETVFRTDPVPEQLLWQRALMRGPGFAYCGLSHTIAGLEIGNVLEQYCLAPTALGDAIVCPSKAIKSVIRSFWDSYEDYLARRFGTKFRCQVQQPIIPLGADIERFTRICTPEKRASQRKALGFAEDDIAVLWVGRLSSAIKAHPLPMFRAVEEAAQKTKKHVHFVMVGYFVPDEAEQAFKDLAKDICPTVDVQFIASDDPRFPDNLWAAGDIFLSLIDNMQESFGLTPVEAIAANLPRVITDWDGYRDCVTHGVDGFLIRTMQPPPGQGHALSEQLLGGREVYSGYLAKTTLSVVVDHHQAAEALLQLIEYPDLRRSMVEKARERLPDYDWKNIIPSYEQLWAELAAERRKALVGTPRTNWPAIPPQAPDPFTMYASFPSRALAETDCLRVCASADDIRMLWRHEINVLAMDVMPHPDNVMAMVKWLSTQGSANIGAILRQYPDEDKGKLWRCIAWLIKLGILTLD